MTRPAGWPSWAPDPPTARQCEWYREEQGYPVFREPYDLNLLISRSEAVGQFDDVATWWWYDRDGRVGSWSCVVTSSAWAHPDGGEWVHHTHPAGCVYIVDQHCPGAYRPGLHNSRLALRQQDDRHMLYVRWPPGRGRAPTVPELEALPRFRAYCGTHMHDRASARRPDRPARDDSEGCVVYWSRADRDHAHQLIERQIVHVGSDVVSPTFVRRSILDRECPA